MKKVYNYKTLSLVIKVFNWINLNIVIPWYKNRQGSIGKIYFGDSTGPVIVKKYKTYSVVR